MIAKPTVFILGAGVSMPYGFPSGKQLIEHICEATRLKTSSISSIPDDSRYLFSREDIQSTLIDQFGKQNAESFGNALFLSHQYSIDSFLEHRTEHIEIGKLAIALFILRKEMEADLFSFENRNKGCYQYLFSKLNTSWDSFAENQVGFITFNYDRSLEHFLFNSLQNTHNKSQEKCAEQLSKIPIIHVHGLLGKLPWQSEAGVVPYGTLNEYTPLNRLKFSSTQALKASKQIKIITEDQSNSSEFQAASQLLNKAEHIYFLGFGYHPTNMERLRVLAIPKIRDGQTDLMRGTGIGLEDSERRFIQARWTVSIFDTTSDSLLFLRRYAILD